MALEAHLCVLRNTTFFLVWLAEHFGVLWEILVVLVLSSGDTLGERGDVFINVPEILNHRNRNRRE